VKEFAEKLSKAIKNNGITQTALAKKMHTLQQNVSNWVNDIYEPSISQIIELCKILETTPNDLFGFPDGFPDF
jgi:transcriptional regulator with XRE-family HTH domain